MGQHMQPADRSLQAAPVGHEVERLWCWVLDACIVLMALWCKLGSGAQRTVPQHCTMCCCARRMSMPLFICTTSSLFQCELFTNTCALFGMHTDDIALTQ